MQYEYDHNVSHRVNKIRAAKAGMTEDEFMKFFVTSRTTARMFIYRVLQGVICEQLAPHQMRKGRRGHALDMFAAGKSLEEVVNATGLKRATASVYRWEARQIAFNAKPRDPLCE